MGVIYMDDKKFTCPVCGMEFKTKEDHDSHHAAMHSAQPTAEIICEHCGYATRDVADMEAHKKMHPGKL